MPGNLGSSGVGGRLGMAALAVAVLGALLWQQRSRSTPSLVGAPPRGDAPGAAPAAGSPAQAAAPRRPSGGPNQPVVATAPIAAALATAPASAYDPFARHGDADPPARVLVAVGELQLGVLSDARVRDEASLVALLTSIGSALEQLRLAPDQTPAAARQQLVEGYKEELGRYVDGEVELHGRDWNLGLEVGEVQPRPQPHEQGWRPRPE